MIYDIDYGTDPHGFGWTKVGRHDGLVKCSTCGKPIAPGRYKVSEKFGERHHAGCVDLYDFGSQR